MLDTCAATFEAPDPSSDVLADSRRQCRVRCCLQAWAVPIDRADERYSVMVQDISTIGVGFASAHEFSPGTWLLLTMQFPNGAWRKILCFTRRCQAVAGGLQQTGAEFEAAIAIDSPNDSIPGSWLEWVLDQEDRQANPQGHSVLEPGLIATCGTEEAEMY